MRGAPSACCGEPPRKIGECAACRPRVCGIWDRAHKDDTAELGFGGAMRRRTAALLMERVGLRPHAVNVLR